MMKPAEYEFEIVGAMQVPSKVQLEQRAEFAETANKHGSAAGFSRASKNAGNRVYWCRRCLFGQREHGCDNHPEGSEKV